MKKLIADTKAYIVLLLSALVIIVWVLVLGSSPVSRDTTPVRIVISQGASAGEVASILAGKGLVRSRLVFLLTCRMSGSSGMIKPGVYGISRSTTVPQIIKRLVNGESLESWVTIPEGYTARQIADLLARKQLANSDAFVQLVITRGYEFPRYSFIRGGSIEGYLFPDTYLIARGTDSKDIVEKMLDAFGRKVLQPRRDQLENAVEARFGLGQDDFTVGLNKILTMASLVEREAKIPRDRPVIAAVLWNRLAKSMRLEVCASVSYVPGESRENKDKVYISDTKVDSPYNTYLHAGLPPGPICNPGLAAVDAVLKPAKVDYLFYVAKPDGSHVFSRTFQEHEKAKNAIRNGKI